jgi:molybdenum cofactor cytidylyltransferase
MLAAKNSSEIVVVGLLLAAGKSERFGSSKSLAKLPSGKTVLETSLDNLRAAVDEVVIVTRRNADELAHVRALASDTSRERVSFVINENAAQGMGTSIASGVAVSPHATYWLVALGDMPFIRSETFAATAKLARESVSMADNAPIIITQHQGKRAHPIIFPNRCRDALLSLHSDEGARSVIVADALSHSPRVLETDDSGVMRDVDAPADLR